LGVIIQDLQSKGIVFLKVYEYKHYEDDFSYNENTGFWKNKKIVVSTDEDVYCPKQTENGKNKRIGLFECQNQCEYYFGVLEDVNFSPKIACGFKNKLTNK